MSDMDITLDEARGLVREGTFEEWMQGTGLAKVKTSKNGTRTAFCDIPALNALCIRELRWDTQNEAYRAYNGRYWAPVRDIKAFIGGLFHRGFYDMGGTLKDILSNALQCVRNLSAPMPHTEPIAFKDCTWVHDDAGGHIVPHSRDLYARYAYPFDRSFKASRTYSDELTNMLIRYVTRMHTCDDIGEVQRYYGCVLFRPDRVRRASMSLWGYGRCCPIGDTDILLLKALTGTDVCISEGITMKASERMDDAEYKEYRDMLSKMAEPEHDGEGNPAYDELTLVQMDAFVSWAWAGYKGIMMML